MPLPRADAPAAHTGRSGPGTPWRRPRELAHATGVPTAARAVTLEQAAGLTLADDLRTHLPLPAFDTSAMDGHAVAGFGAWRLRGAVRAGRVRRGVLAAGRRWRSPPARASRPAPRRCWWSSARPCRATGLRQDRGRADVRHEGLGPPRCTGRGPTRSARRAHTPAARAVRSA
ncbi:hypothetical protein [Kitasatospora paranensis]|uniref:MoeA N-terminal and linker domain-containing protein n=1 Tax=Kitasatospora paranensis TaxID=258053 RepID=A0ABW2G1L8_9ACTN